MTKTIRERSRMRSRELLTKASDVLAYEWDILRACHTWLVDHQQCKGSAIYKAMVEAMLLHMRALIEFFRSPYDEQRYPKDIRLEHWFPPTSCEFVRLRRCADELKDIQSMIHKRLAHLTLDRIEPHIQWEEEKVKAVDDLMITFVDLAGDRIGTKIQEFAEKKPAVVVTSAIAFSTGGSFSGVTEAKLAKPKDS